MGLDWVGVGEVGLWYQAEVFNSIATSNGEALNISEQESKVVEREIRR